MEQYKIPMCPAEAEFTEKKSRFICGITPVSSEDEALVFLKSVRAKHREASHNVYAYRIKENGVSRCSDDGEPSGTAGIPLLEAFIKQEVFDFCCVATRYFGGVLLGAGGLIRAYARCGALAIETSGVGLMREKALCRVALRYPQYEAVKRLLLYCGALITSEDFSAEITITFSLPSEDLPALTESAAELTSGSLHVHVEGSQMSIY